MAPSLLSLSEELLVRIINFVDYPSLKPLTLVCQTFNRLAIPQLYADVHFEGAYSEGVAYLIPFTFHVLQNPDLASLVRSFSIRSEFGIDETYLAQLKEEVRRGGKFNSLVHRKGWPSHPDLDSVLRKAIEDVENEEETQEELFEKIRAGSDEGAILLMLLPKLRNIRKLDLPQSIMGPGPYLLRLFRKITKREAPFDERPVFQHLTDVLIAGADDKYPNAPDWFGACVELPAIRRLYGYRMGNNGQTSVTKTMGELGTGTSAAEVLELRESKLYPEDLDKLLRACRNLKTFIYEVGHAWAWYPARSQDMMRAMEPLEGTLENLVLDHPYYLGDLDDGEFLPVSFSKFEKLRYLKTSTMFLAGAKEPKTNNMVKSFPIGLESLHVNYVGVAGNGAATMSALQQVLEQKECVVPKLGKLTIQGMFVKHPDRLDGVKELAQSAKAKELGFVILTCENREVDPYKKRSERGWGLDGEVEWQECIYNRKGELEVLDVVGFGW